MWVLMIIIFLVSVSSHAETSSRSCISENRHYCKRVRGYKGNLPKIKLFMGRSDKSDLPEVERLDLEALANSYQDLPADLKSKSYTTLNLLRDHLKNEQDIPTWYSRLQDLRDDFSKQVLKTTKERTQKARRNIYAIRSVEFKRQRGIITDQITKAKYEKHPNWIRVLNTFDEVKRDVKEVVSDLNLSEKEEQRLKNKIDEVEVSLPLSFNMARIAKWMMDTNCNTNMIQALYIPEIKKIIICAGYFNAYQSKSLLYFVIAHELAHSIDPYVLRLDDFKESPQAKILKSLINGENISCSKWREQKEQNFPRLLKVRKGITNYEHLINCFGFNTEEIEIETVRKVARDLTKKHIAKANFRELYDEYLYRETYKNPINYVQKKL